MSSHISLNVKASNLNTLDKEDMQDLTKVKIKLTDTLQKLVEIVTDGSSGTLFVSGKAFPDLELTIEKAELHDGRHFHLILHLFVSKDEGFGGEPLLWSRFKKENCSSP